jgi:hypothetical protein
VTTWADQSANHRDLTASGTAPTFSSTGFNSKPGITATNNTSSLKSAAFNIASTTVAFFLVGNFPTGTGSNARMLAYYTGTDFSDVNSILAFDNGSSGNVDCYHASNQSGILAVTAGANVRLGNTYNAGTVNLYLNNGAPVAGSVGSNTLGSASTVFALITTSSPGLSGSVIAESVMVNIVPSSGQLTSLDNYFKTKWGL